VSNELDPEKLTRVQSLLNEWHTAAAELSTLKIREEQLRRAIFAEAFEQPVPGPGNKVKIGHGMALVAKLPINYRIDQPALEAMRNENTIPLIEAVIAYKPSVREGAFKDLSKDERLLFADVITESPGLPSLEIKSASKVKW